MNKLRAFRLISTRRCLLRKFQTLCVNKQTALNFIGLMDIKPETKEWNLNTSPNACSDIILFYNSHSYGLGLLNIVDIVNKSASR